MILLYWDIGRGIVEKQESLGWGDGIVEAPARDLQQAFPEMRGFAPRSLWNMRRLFLAYASPEMDGVKTRSFQLENLRQVVAEIP
jgi:hypothetical protein